MMMKRISAAVLALALSVSTLAVSASAEEYVKVTKNGMARVVEISQDADLEYNAPSGGAVKVLSAVRDGNTITAKWEKPSGSFDGYMVKCVSPSGQIKPLTFDKGKTEAYWIADFDPDKNWTYYICTYNIDVYDNKVFGKDTKLDITVKETVSAPGKVVFTSVSHSDTVINVEWKDLDCDGYEVELKDQNNPEWKVLGVITDNDATIKKLYPGYTYSLRVRGFRKVNGTKLYGDYSDERVIKTDDAAVVKVEKPGDIVYKKVVTGSDSIRVYWEAIKCDGYQIYFNKGDEWKHIANVSNKTLDYRFTGLEPDHTYWVTIRAYNKSSDGTTVEYGEFNKREIKTDKEGTSTEIVSKPGKAVINTAKCDVGSDKVTITWTGVECDGYTLCINETGYKWEEVANVSKGTTSYTFTNLKPNHAYWFTVGAYNNQNNGNKLYGTFSDNYYTVTKAAAPAAVKPPKTEFTSFSRSATAIRLNWTPVNCDGYFIYRYNTSSKTWERVSILKDGTRSFKRFTGLQPNTTYIYRMKTFKFTGDGGKVYSDYSSPRSVTTKKK